MTAWVPISICMSPVNKPTRIASRRLLQGDVGSGKTLVALMSMLMALDNGFQACMMAPTEILANQHYETIRELLYGMEVRVELLTGSVKGKRREAILAASGSSAFLSLHPYGFPSIPASEHWSVQKEDYGSRRY